MAWAKVRSLVAGLFRRGRVEADLADEVEFHIETRARDLVARGMSPDLATRPHESNSAQSSDTKRKSAAPGGCGSSTRPVPTCSVARVRCVGARVHPGGRPVARTRHRRQHAGLQPARFDRAKPVALPESDRLVAIWTVPAGRPDQLGTSSITRYTSFRDHARSFESIAASTVSRAA